MSSSSAKYPRSVHWDTNKSHFFVLCCVLVWLFFFSIRKSSAKKRCSPWPMTSCKHVLRKLNSIWSEEEGPGCSLHPNNTQTGLFVLHTLRASQHSSSELPASRCPARLPWSQAVGWDQGLPWDAAASLQCCGSDGETGQSCWILPSTEPQPWLGLSVAVALIRAVFDNYYYLIAGHCWLCKHSSERYLGMEMFSSLLCCLFCCSPSSLCWTSSWFNCFLAVWRLKDKFPKRILSCLGAGNEFYWNNLPIWVKFPWWNCNKAG